jgi:nicotinate phosphoribosyltransferase
MAHSALASLRHANRYALEAWLQVYKGELGIALPDTFGTDSFLRDFDRQLAMVYKGVRHDSGDPFEFAKKIIKFYEQIDINPQSKTIVFSDSLNPQKCIKLAEAFGGAGGNKRLIHCQFGIGTNFTNDFLTRALNIVIKMTHLNGIPVVKVSDDKSKAIGDRDALRVAMWTHFGIPLDA